jgi:hypothetical protein
MIFLYSSNIANASTIIKTKWTPRVSGVSEHLNGIIWGDNMFVAVGNHGIIVISCDGINWVSKDSCTINNLNKVVWTGSKFVIVGDSGTILTSVDGNIWTKQNSYISRASLTGVALIFTPHHIPISSNF